MDDDAPWIPPCIHEASVDEDKTFITGWVDSKEDLDVVLEAHKRASLSTFVTWSDDIKKKEKSGRRLLWQYQDIHSNTPFNVERSVVFACQYGHQRKQGKETKEKDSDHNYKKKRFNIQTTKKVNCTAKLTIRYVRRYPEYVVDEKAGRHMRQTKLDTLTDNLNKGNVECENKIYVKLPLKAAHTNHNVTVESGFSNSMHADLKNVIKQHVEMGLTSVPYLRRVLQQHVKKNLCSPDMVNPVDTDRSYHPTSRDIYNYVHQCLSSGSFSGLDQENLEKKIEDWRASTSDKFFFRPCQGDKPTSSTKQMNRTQKVFLPDSDDEEDDCTANDVSCEGTSDNNNTFLFVHQSEQQRKIMEKYGKFILIDSTYKTSKYALPLFLVVVRTNVCYLPVAEFIVESENICNISEALMILKQWNEEWEPEAFMMDYSDIEYQAVHQEFPSAKKYLCIFHIEQAWLRWTKKRKNNLTDDETAQFLSLMREILRAPNAEEYENAVSKLRESEVFAKEQVRRYLDSHWLSIPERWCRAFIDTGFNSMMRTNNGVESLNSSLKNFYTKLTGTGTIANLVEIIIQDFVPDQIMSFRRLNYQYSSQYRQYNEHVPEFLHNLPRNVVKHCLIRYAAAANYCNDDVEEISDGVLYVKSENEPDRYYAVDFGAHDRLPSCSCDDFLKTFLPCKHFFAALRNTKYCWNDLSATYIQSPYLLLDSDFLSSGALEVSVDCFDQGADLELIEVQHDIDLHFQHKSSLLCKARNNLRENIKIMDDLSFLSQSPEILTEVSNALVELIGKLKISVETIDSLPVHKGKSATKPSNAKTTHPLPVRRKRKAAKRKNATSIILSVKEPNYLGVQDITAENSPAEEGPPPEKNMHSQKRNLTSQHAEPNYLGVQDKTAENAPAEICLDADNEQNCDISKDVLEKFTEFLKALEISAMIQEAKETSHIGRDLIRRVGDAVLYQSSNPMELLIKMKGLLDEDLEDTIKQRFISIALNHLVMKGQLILPEEVDPRLQEARIENLIQHLLQGAKESYSTRLIEDQRPIKKTPTVMTNTKRRVEFTEEAKKFKQRKMMALQKSCPDPFPGGGLLNPPRKNLCYANSLLQCLRLTDIHTLLQHHRNCEASESCFTCGLKDFFENAPITAEPLCERMTTFWSDYTVGRQQDCHELYYKMMNEIQEKCLRWMNLSDQKRIFYGELQYSYTCKACGYQSCNTETFSNLSVSIEQHQTVTQCLDGYFRDEHLDKQCVRCGINREFLRKTELTDIPKNLVIQLQRVSARRTKIMKKIDLHLNLNLRMHVVKDKELEHKLDLFGVIVHKGQTLKVGHYIAMVKFGTDWYRVDDMKVTKISASGLKNIDGQSTLLFYRTLPRPYIS